MRRPNDDDTIRLAPPSRRAAVALPAVTIAVAAVLGATSALFLFRPVAPPAVTTPVRFADEATIDANDPGRLAVFRLQSTPSIVILDFPSLAEQGRMFDRIAALIEKKGCPRDRVLDDDALAAAIRADGDTPDTWYYGHDYRAADVVRFFRLADQEGIRLDADEEHLRLLTARLGRATAGFGAVVSLPHVDPVAGVDRAVRIVILHHELSHGAYFTDPVYARAVATAWRDVLTADERALVRAYLAAEEYDPADDDLMMNEMQAYIAYTPAGPFFDPARLGISPDRLAVVRDSLRAAGPSWLASAR